jgi:predicted NACHT family NTPase
MGEIFTRAGFHMLKTWSFWKTFFTYYLALVAGIWGFVEASTYFAGDSLKQLLGPNWWVLYYVLPLLIAFVAATQTNAKEETPAETLDERNRRVMLNHVEEFWVKGILEKSLHGAALLELGIKEDPGKVSYPWTIKREGTNETLPAGKSMLKIFQEIGLGRSLLILGAPGSGKTTMLLELARQLIERARQDETEPIPVVFNLASWKEHQTLADWLAEQLNIVYYVPKKTAPAWVNENRMLLLLDGLDEAKADSRGKCVDAINQFRKEHGLTSLVVCSRIEEYAALDAKLSLEGAITLQPLTSRQVNAYFERFGKNLAGVKQLLKKDKALQELAETPLMLSIMVLAYKDSKPDELIISGNLEKQRRHLFDTYITRMFERSARTTNIPFSEQQTLHSLHWLARIMTTHNIITYQIESMQPKWLDTKSQRRLY